ncbi:MAG: zinc ribbon domain-containing protein, partial [Thermoplasmata archaeon]|nr:zinc ribbon domain-containing protein [Thermoplasmata archaeon]
PEDTDMDGDGVPNTSDAFPKDPTKWEEEKESNGNESFLSQKIGPLPLYAYLVIVIIGLAAGAGALKMKGGKSGGKAQKTEQYQQPRQPTQQPQSQQQFQQPPPRQPPQPQQTGTWTCTKCGKEVDGRYQFCLYCGNERE